MTPQELCLACNAPLTQIGDKGWRCSNRNCPTGGEIRRCGYCRRIALAISDGVTKCFNPGCRLYQVQLSGCPQCQFYSFMAAHWREDFCINRRCPGNAEIVQTCEFCNHPSFLRDEGIDFCSKRDCPALLQPMRECSFCHKWMVDGSTNKCLNSSCSHFDEQIVECGSCNQRQYSLDADRCFNTNCPSNTRAPVERTPTPVPRPDPSAVEMTIPAIDQPEYDTPVLKPSAPLPSDDTTSAHDLQTTARQEQPVTPTQQATPTPELRLPSGATSPATAGAGPIISLDDGLLGISDAFEVVRGGLLASEDCEGDCPLVLVMGTAGAGKTAYLAALGKILCEGKASFHFPHEGVEAHPIDYDQLADKVQKSNPAIDHQLLKSQMKTVIGDLVFKFADNIFDGYIAKGIWCEFTRPNAGQFLVANITKLGQPVANIVTLETSGENFVTLLKGINDLAELERNGGPIVAVMAEMLLHAQGLIVLMDPSETENNKNYQPFFKHLGRHLSKRVHRILHDEIERRLADEPEELPQPAGSGMDLAEKYIASDQVKAALHEIQQLLADLSTYGYAAVERDPDRFQKVLSAMPRKDEAVAFQKELNARRRKSAKRELWESCLRKALHKPQRLAKVAYGLTKKDAALSPRLLKAHGICFERGVHVRLVDAFNLEAGPAPFQDQFPHLRDIALVFSKADMHPVVHPPQAYPRQKLPSSVEDIERIQNYLRFLHGDVRYYNSSVLGYSTAANGQFFPGAEASLTPVNVIEPLFDMLSDKLGHR